MLCPPDRILLDTLCGNSACCLHPHAHHEFQTTCTSTSATPSNIRTSASSPVESKTRPDPNKVNQTPQTPTPATDLLDTSCTSVSVLMRKHTAARSQNSSHASCKPQKPMCGGTAAPNTGMPSGCFFRVWQRVAHNLRQSVRLDEVCNVGGKLLDDCVVETLDVLEHALVVLRRMRKTQYAFRAGATQCARIVTHQAAQAQLSVLDTKTIWHVTINSHFIIFKEKDIREER